MTFIKDVSANADAGTATQWGGNDINVLDDYFDNVDITPKVAKINTTTYFRSGKFEIRNPADTFSNIFISSAIVANRNITIPLLTGDDTLSVLGMAQTFTAAKTFNDLTLKQRNPADTFSYTIKGGAITADRQLNLPIITGTDTLAVLGLNNGFTEPQDIIKNQEPLLNLYRSSSTANDLVGINFDLQDSGAARQTYAQIRGEIVTNTAGAEQGRLLFYTIDAGTVGIVAECSQSGDFKIGKNRRLRLTQTNLTAERTFDFPDASGTVVTIAANQTLLNKILDGGSTYNSSTPNTLKGTGIDNPYSGGTVAATLIRSGVWTGTTGTQGEGCVAGTWTAVGTPANFLDASEGFGQDFSTGAVSGNNAGIRQGSVRWRRDWTIHAILRFKLSSTTTIRAFFGWSSDVNEIAGETSLDNFSGAGIGRRAADTNWQLITNDGDTTTNYADTGIAVSSASFIQIEMHLDVSNSFRAKINSTNQTAVTTEIPANTTGLSFHAEIEASAPSDRTLTLMPIYFSMGTS